MDYFHNLLIPIVSTLLLLFLVKCFTNSNSTGKYPPTPTALPFIGHLHLLKSNLPASLEHLAKRYGPLMRLRLGDTEFVVASDEKSAREIMKTFDADFASKFAPGPNTFHIYKDSYFVGAPYNAYWKFMKTLCMTKLFTGSQLARLIGIGEDETCKLVKSLMNRSKAGEPCDLTEELAKATNNMIYRMLVGRRCSENLGQAAEIRKFILDSLKHAAKFQLGEMFGPLKKFDLFGNGKKIKSALMGYDQLIEQIMKDYEDNDLNNCANDHEKDVMDILLETYKDTNAKVKVTREQIKTFVMEMIMASVDTIVAAIRAAMVEVINRPDILKSLREEISSVMGNNRLIKESDASKLPYLQAVAMETLRLHHPSPTLRRLSRKDSTINGFDIKDGTKVFINIYSIMRDPNRYEEPEKFMPDRFLANCTEMKAQDFHYTPFGSGRRACPGSYLAIPVMQLTIGSLVQCFDWKVKDGENADNKASGTGYSGACPSALVCYPKARFNPF